MGLLAEQILIECPPARLEELFSHRPVTWMKPLLRLAGDEGEALGLALFTPPVDSRSRRRYGHAVNVHDGQRVAGNLRVGLHWHTTDYRLLFSEFDGALEVRALGDNSIVSIEGRFARPLAGAAPDMAARRAAESAVRSLLGHLRSAVEGLGEPGVARPGLAAEEGRRR